MPTPSILPNKKLLRGPDNLTTPAFGDDELNEQFRRNPKAALIEIHSIAPQRVTLSELIAFNERSGPTPNILVPTEVRLVNTQDRSDGSTNFVLRREFQALIDIEIFTLRPLRPADEITAKSKQNTDQSTQEAIDNFLKVIEKGSITDLDLFLATVQLDRENELTHLQHLAGLHRDAVQNAVDILQTKRIDFLENPQEVGVLGSIMTFVLAGILANVVSSIIGSVIGGVVELIAIGVFAFLGRWSRRGAKMTISAFIKERQGLINKAILDLKAVKSKSGQNELQTIFKKRIQELKKQNKQAKTERELLYKGLLDDSIARAQAIGARIKDPNTEGKSDIVNRAGNLVIEKATEAVTAFPNTVTQTKADSIVSMSAIPLDVAMKLNVQIFFDPWLEAVEDSIRFLKQARLTLARFGVLPKSGVDEIINLVGLSGDLDEFNKSFSSLMAGSVDLRSDLTAYYEFLLWLTMYRQVLSRVPLGPTAAVVDPVGGLQPGPTGKLLPKGHDGTMNLLEYLALRFFNMGKIEGKGEDAKLVFSDEELLAVFVTTEALCARLFPSEVTQKSANTSELDNQFTQALQQIRFAIMPYRT